ncbi:MAG: PqiC family protein [bacterium]
MSWIIVTVKLSVMFGLVWGLQACTANSQGTRFYSLVALNPASSQPKPQLKIGVGPIYLPRALKRPQLVIRKNATELTLAEDHQWVGSLREDVLRVVSENMAKGLGTERIETYPWKQSFRPHYQVRINIERLDGELGKNVTLKARWRLIKAKKIQQVQPFNVTISVKGQQYNDYVLAQSQALAALTQAIQQAIQ